MVMTSSLENGVLCLTSSLSENYLEMPGGFEKKLVFWRLILLINRIVLYLSCCCLR